MSDLEYEDVERLPKEELTTRLADANPAVVAAATSLGDLAFFRRSLDCDRVIPALTSAMQDPAISDPARFSLSMVTQFVCDQTA